MLHCRIFQLNNDVSVLRVALGKFFSMLFSDVDNCFEEAESFGREALVDEEVGL